MGGTSGKSEWSISLRTSSGTTGAATSLVCTCSNSGASLGISRSGQDTSCQSISYLQHGESSQERQTNVV
jgi:hypothetical protein